MCVNDKGSYYLAGKKFSVTKKLSALRKYKEIKERDGKCTVRSLAKAAQISIGTAAKYVKEYEANGGFIDEMVSEQKKKPKGKINYGSIIPCRTREAW